MRIVVAPALMMRMLMLMFILLLICCYDVSMLSIVPPTMLVAKNKWKSTDVSKKAQNIFLMKWNAAFEIQIHMCK